MESSFLGMSLSISYSLSDCESYQNIGMDNDVAGFFAYVFNPDENILDRTDFTFSFFQQLLNDNNVKAIRDVLSDKATIEDVNLSIVQAILIMTENVEEVQDVRQHVQQNFDYRMISHRPDRQQLAFE